MISDGWGPASATLTRSYSKKALNIDPYLVGTVRTLSYDRYQISSLYCLLSFFFLFVYFLLILFCVSLVTDSAAGATAYSVRA